MCASIFLLIGTGVERYLAVCRPHHYHTVSNVHSVYSFLDRFFPLFFYIMPDFA